MLRNAALAKIDVSEKCSACVIRVRRISELGTTVVVTSNIVIPRSVRRLMVSTNVPRSQFFVTLKVEEQQTNL
jgi:hypothetical protein